MDKLALDTQEKDKYLNSFFLKRKQHFLFRSRKHLHNNPLKHLFLFIGIAFIALDCKYGFGSTQQSLGLTLVMSAAYITITSIWVIFCS